MDLNRVAVFVRVVEERGFTAAAKALGLPKSSVSRSVALLERELGARLLLRSTRSVTLTDAGAAFYQRASRGLSAVEEAREAVVELESDVRGRVRITAPLDVGVSLLAPLVAEFVVRHPNVHVDVALTSRVVDLVEEGFDLALRVGAAPDSTLVARKLSPLELGLYAAPRYLAERGEPRHVADLARHRCVLFRAPQGRATWTLTGPSGPRSVEVSGPVGADDMAFVQTAVRAGLGIGILPTFVGRKSEDALARVLPDHSVSGAALHLVYPASRYLPGRVALFRDFVTGSLGGRAVAPRSAPVGRRAR